MREGEGGVLTADGMVGCCCDDDEHYCVEGGEDHDEEGFVFVVV